MDKKEALLRTIIQISPQAYVGNMKKEHYGACLGNAHPELVTNVSVFKAFVEQELPRIIHETGVGDDFLMRNFMTEAEELVDEYNQFTQNSLEAHAFTNAVSYVLNETLRKKEDRPLRDLVKSHEQAVIYEHLSTGSAKHVSKFLGLKEHLKDRLCKPRSDGGIGFEMSEADFESMFKRLESGTDPNTIFIT